MDSSASPILILWDAHQSFLRIHSFILIFGLSFMNTVTGTQSMLNKYLSECKNNHIGEFKKELGNFL